MRRKFFWEIGLSLLVVLAALASAASAQTATTPAPKQPAKAQLVQALKSAHQLLAAADRDYNGHRARAAQEVRKALKELGCHHKTAQAGSTPNNGAVAPKQTASSGQPPVHEPQANSDAQLRQSQQILQGVLKQIGARHPKAAADVKTAIGEINAALSVR